MLPLTTLGVDYYATTTYPTITLTRQTRSRAAATGAVCWTWAQAHPASARPRPDRETRLSVAHATKPFGLAKLGSTRET